MPGKVLLTAAAAFMLAGAGVPASDLHLGRVAGSADAVPSSLTIEPAKPSVSVRVSNTSGKPGRVVGWMGGRSATAATPDHSATVTLTWDGPAAAGADSGVLRLELYPDGETDQPMDVEEHPFAAKAGGYNQPSAKPSETKKPSQSASPSQSPSVSPSALPVTGSKTSSIAALGGGSLLFGVFVLGTAWMLRRRFVRDRLS